MGGSKFRHWAILVFVLISVVDVFAGGNSEQDQSAVRGTQHVWKTRYGSFVLSERIANKAARGEKLVFVSSTIDSASPWAQFVRLGIEKAAKEFPIEYRMVGPVDSVSEKQVSELETLVQLEQVDGLAIAAWDAESLVPIYKMAWERGIPAVNFEGDSPKSARIIALGASHKEIGQTGARAFMKLHPSKTGKLATFAAFPQGEYAVERFAGFFDVLKSAGYNFDIVGPFELTLDESKGYGVVENAFLANPDVEAVYMPDEYIVLPAEYARRNSLKDKVLLIGVNEFPAVLSYVKQGLIQHTTGNNVIMSGYLPAKILYEFITGGKTVEDHPHIELVDITPDSVDSFMAETGISAK